MFNYDIVDEVVKKIVDEFSPRMVIIFGSVASRTARDDSDIDLLVVMETDVDPYYRAAPIDIALRKFRVDRDIIVVTPEEYETHKDDEYSFLSDIVKTGIVAYAV